MENVGLYFLVGFVVWYILGAIVCTSLDNENQELLAWAESFPYGSSLGVFLVLMCFPAIVYMRLTNR